MSVKTIEVEIYQCDHVSPGGERCELSGERNQIKQCVRCGMDICSRHYQLITVNRSGGTLLSYYFCFDHAEEFINSHIEDLGDTRPTGAGGMGK